MSLLYVTADRVGQANHGGGQVTWHESEALRQVASLWKPPAGLHYSPFQRWGREELEATTFPDCHKGTDLQQDPWIWDTLARSKAFNEGVDPRLIHCYAGTFSRLVEHHKEHNGTVTYTAAAHDVEASRKAHREAGIPYNYPHITDPALWQRYVAGYLAADCLICPSRHSAKVMEGFGARNRIEIIPHGVNLPAEVKLPPKRFAVGYLGSCTAPDKGVRCLLEAWKQLNYRGDALLVLAGYDSTSPHAMELVRRHGGGDIWLRGWVEDPADFYNSISVYVQPSVTEGFGLEVLEAASHGRPVICSGGAGAVDCVLHRETGLIVPACAPTRIASAIEEYHQDPEMAAAHGRAAREHVAQWTWDKIRARYQSLWSELLEGK